MVVSSPLPFLLAIFCLAAGGVTVGARFTTQIADGIKRSKPYGIVFVGVVLLTGVAGVLLRRAMTPAEQLPTFGGGSTLLLLVGMLYLLCLARGALRFPVWIVDALILCAASAAIWNFGELSVKVLSRPASDTAPGGFFYLKNWAAPLTIGWIWMIARMTAALNRVPQVTGGYLGVVALTFLALLQFGSRTNAFFPSAASAALAGAGLATIPLAIRRPDFNLGWSAGVAMGFLLALIAVIGLLKNAAFAILLLSAVAFGLPLLDVSFYQLRAALRGKRVAWQEERIRLYEALLQRGLSPLKVAMLYLGIGICLCGFGVLIARFVLAEGVQPFPLILRIVTVMLLGFLVFLIFFSLTRVLMRRSEGEDVPEEIEAFGVRISPVSMCEAMDKIEGFIAERTPHHVVTSDANAILRAQEDEEYAGILRRAALITPDGYGVIWGARLLNLPIYERVTGVDMVTGICERAVKAGYAIYILGSDRGIAATAAQKLQERYPGLKIAGTQHGFWKQEDLTDEDIVAQIRDARPDVLFVAMGIPLQEKFIARHLDELQVPVCLGVGGSFDVYSEKLKRAPLYIQRSGMEWLYRVWQEPWRWKRMSYVPRFMAFAIREWMFGPGHRTRPNSKTVL